MKYLRYGLILFLLSILGDRYSLFVSSSVQAKSCHAITKKESGEKQVNLIELYTSEGCSSCPPAEKWLNSLYDKKDLFKTFIPVAFHVNYWDYLGHKDDLGSKDFADKQRALASVWGSRTIYTPGFVLNGDEWKPLYRTLPKKSSKNVGNLSVEKKKKNSFEINFQKEGSYMLHVAYLNNDISTKVRRGENAGRTLKHFFVASDWQMFPINGKSKKTIQIKEASKKKYKYKEQQILFWITSRDNPKPIQSLAGCFN